MIALITPTGSRPKQIQLCAEFMRRQDYKGKVLWIIVDDGEPVTCKGIRDDFRKDWQILKITPVDKWKPGDNTQAKNLVIGLSALKWMVVDFVFIIEDDDYYAPNYLSVMGDQLRGFDIAGQIHTIYYNPILRGWYRNGNNAHASLFQVGFNFRAVPLFMKACQMSYKFIDINFFRLAKECKINLFDGPPLAVGIKGLPGRPGIGIGHRMRQERLMPDPELVKLKELIGEDYKYYDESANIHNRS